MKIPRMEFYGETYVEEEDHDRLAKMHARIKAYMLEHGEFRTEGEIAEDLGYLPHSDIAKRVRESRERKKGYHWVEARRRFGAGGLWEYKVHPAGTGDKNKKSKLQRRAEKYLAFAGALADALEELDSEHPLLKKWDNYTQKST